MNPPKRDHRMYLQDILSAIAKIGQYTHGGKDAFFAQDLVQDGVIRQFSIIGEAAGKLPARTKAVRPDIPWQKIVAMRNIIVHDYSETDLPTIWDAVERDLPQLRTAIEAMLRRTVE